MDKKRKNLTESLETIESKKIRVDNVKDEEKIKHNIEEIKSFLNELNLPPDFMKLYVILSSKLN